MAIDSTLGPVTLEAHSLVYGARQEAYDHPSRDFSRTAALVDHTPSPQAGPGPEAGGVRRAPADGGPEAVPTNAPAGSGQSGRHCWIR